MALIQVPQNIKTRSSKLRLTGLVLTGIASLLIIASVVNQRLSPALFVNGTVGKLHVTEYEVGTAKDAGWDIASKVWGAAHEHPELEEIDVEVELIVAGGGLVDRYGNKVLEPYIMGTIPVRDLDDVRRYVSEDSYTYDTQDEYAARAINLEYGYLFKKK
jgi:hypothetical protein